MSGNTNLGRMMVILERDGSINLLKRVLSFGYNHTIRPVLPLTGTSILDYNGVTVVDDDGRLGDSFPLAGDVPLYEQPIIRSVRRYITEGDTVVIVGAGWGVVTTIVAGQIGTAGQCISYEGSEKMYARATHTLDVNDVENRVTLNHAVVAENRDVWGDEGGAEFIQTRELPECDALILDCEGAEHTIVPELDHLPRVIIVEAHDGYGDIETALCDHGYTIVDRELYVPSEDTYVLTARRE